METVNPPLSDGQPALCADSVDCVRVDDKAADLALQEQIIRDVASDDLQVLLKLGLKTVLKPHQKVFPAFVFAHIRAIVMLTLPSGPQDGVIFALKRAFEQNTGTAIFDAMGLGKTVESLAIMCCLKRWRPNNGTSFSEANSFCFMFMPSTARSFPGRCPCIRAESVG